MCRHSEKGIAHDYYHITCRFDSGRGHLGFGDLILITFSQTVAVGSYPSGNSGLGSEISKAAGKYMKIAAWPISSL